MNTQKSTTPYGLICAVLCTLTALRLLVGLFSYFRFLNLLSLACYIFIAVMLFMGKRDMMSIAGFGGLTLVSLLWLFNSSGFLGVLMNLAELAAFASLAFIAFVSVTDYLPELKTTVKKLWFIPGAAAALSLLLLIVFYISMHVLRYAAIALVWGLLEIAFILMASLWAVPMTTADSQSSTGTTTCQSSASGNCDDGYISMGMHIALLLLTGGIWLYIWIYRTTKLLNCVEGEEYRNPTTKLLLCMFVPFYFIYWIYKSAQRIDKLAQSKGIPSDISTLCLILAIFVAIVPPILMQDKINAVCQRTSAAMPVAPAAPVTSAAPTAPVAPVTPAVDTVEELKRYKELLDMGILTPEEFDAKKKQLLNM